MNIHIHMLHEEDIPLLQAMETGIADDYILRIAGELMEGDNRMFGLFAGNDLASFGGYSIYANQYAMLGRLRSDRRFRKNGYATTLMCHVRDSAFQLPQIQWVGANTQENNHPARGVASNIGFKPLTTLYNAQTDDVSALANEASPWKEITDINRKREWLLQTYVKNQLIFPYECYYVFPSTSALFPDEVIREWSFYENPEQTRFVITKYDRKKHHYLHVVYPWEDIFEQSGLWATVTRDYERLKQKTNEETYIWYDMPKEQAHILPHDHKWKLESPWMLYGSDKTTWENMQQHKSVQTVSGGTWHD